MLELPERELVTFDMSEDTELGSRDPPEDLMLPAMSIVKEIDVPPTRRRWWLLGVNDVTSLKRLRRSQMAVLSVSVDEMGKVSPEGVVKAAIAVPVTPAEASMDFLSAHVTKGSFKDESGTPLSSNAKVISAESTKVLDAPQLPCPLRASKDGTGAEKETLFDQRPATNTMTYEDLVLSPSLLGSSTIAIMLLSVQDSISRNGGKTRSPLT